MEKCCHFFDLFNRILSPEYPETVFATGGQDVNHLNETYNGSVSDILDNAYVIVQYSDGSRASLDLCMFAEASHHQEEVVIVGHHGKLEAFLPQMEVRTGIRGQHCLQHVSTEIVDDDRIRYRGHHYGSSYLEHLDILENIRKSLGNCSHNSDNRPRTAGVVQGMVAVAVGIAAQMSIAQQRLVRMDEILKADELLVCKRYAGIA